MSQDRDSRFFSGLFRTTSGSVNVRAAINPPVEFQANRSLIRVADRLAWRLSILVLVLSKFRGQAASVGSLHLLLWAMQTPGTMALMAAWWSGREPVDLATIRTDPNLEVTLALATAEDLIELSSTGRAELTARGKEFAAMIDGDGELLASEKELLRSLVPLNDANINRHMGGAPYEY